MTSMEQEALDVIGGNEGRLHYYLIAQELKISAHYAYVICKGLERSGCLDFDTFRGICALTGKGREIRENNWVAELKRQKENIQKQRKYNKNRILKNVEIVNY